MEKLVMKRSNAILPNRRSSQKSDESQPEEFLVPITVILPKGKPVGPGNLVAPMSGGKGDARRRRHTEGPSTP